MMIGGQPSLRLMIVFRAPGEVNHIIRHDARSFMGEVGFAII